MSARKLMKNILVIEDEYDIVALLVIILENEGYKVSTISDATGYETKLREAHADLVLLDLNIGGVNGKLICDYIKTHDDLKSIPVILMSANVDAGRVKEECGAEELISKPFDLNYFTATGEEVCELISDFGFSDFRIWDLGCRKVERGSGKGCKIPNINLVLLLLTNS